MTEAAALALTVAIEAPLAAALGAALCPDRRAGAALRGAVVAAVGTAVTHPFVWAAALALYPRVGVPAAIVLVEAGAIAAEAVGYRWVYGWRRAAAVSLVVNGISASLGVVFTW